MNTFQHTPSKQHRRMRPLGTALPALLLALPVGTALADDSPEVLHLTGIVRDFHSSHPDFGADPASGPGMTPGNVGHVLGPDGKPVFTGQGSKLASQFTNSAGEPIAPHMHNREYVCHLETPESDCVVVSHNWNQGNASYEVCFLAPPVFNEDGTSTWRYQVRELQGPSLSHWTLWLDPNADVVEGTTPGWTWIDSDHPNFPGPGIKWDTSGGVGSGGQIFEVVLGAQYFGTNASWVQAKGGGGTNYGLRPFFGPGSEVSETGSPYKYTWSLEPKDFGDVGGEFVSAEYDAGGITSIESFAQWFSDDPEVNISKPVSIVAEKQPDGSYIFDSSDFFPIDEALFGNEGGGHNYHFTYELRAKFTYECDESDPPAFTFRSSDDLWVFVNDKLAIDMGGIHESTEQTIDLSRMCMDCGGEYKLAIFFVQRHSPDSDFYIETEFEIESDGVPSITAMFD